MSIAGFLGDCRAVTIGLLVTLFWSWVKMGIGATVSLGPLETSTGPGTAPRSGSKDPSGNSSNAFSSGPGPETFVPDCNGCNVFEGIGVGVGYSFNSSEAEELTTATFNCATWNDQ